MKTHKSFAWSIFRYYKDLDGKYYDSFLGVYNFINKLPEIVDGQKILLFKTREIARFYCKQFCKSDDTKYKIVKVLVTIKEVK